MRGNCCAGPRSAHLLLALLGLGIWSCAAGPRSPAHFQGHARAPVSLDPMRALSTLPNEYDEIGHVSAQCTLSKVVGRVEGQWLSDFDCSAHHLRRAIRFQAAQAGGSLLVGQQCTSLPVRVPERDALRIRCSAGVAVPRSLAALKSPLPPVARGVAPDGEGPSCQEVWNTRVDFTPAAQAGTRPARRASLVADLAHAPIGHILLGDIAVRCEHGCSQRGARAAMRAVAGRVGGAAVVGVRCIRSGEAWLCTGRASAYEHEPEFVGWAP